MKFFKVLELLEEKKELTRKGWNGKGLSIKLQIPDKNSKMTRPYIYMKTPPNSTNHYGTEGNHENRIPWLPSQTDLFADDWEMVKYLNS